MLLGYDKPLKFLVYTQALSSSPPLTPEIFAKAADIGQVYDLHLKKFQDKDEFEVW